MNRLEFSSQLLMTFCASVFLVVSTACGTKSPGSRETGDSPAKTTDPALEGERIIEKYLSQSRADQSLTMMRAKVHDSDGATREVELTMRRKRAPDGAQWTLAEFTSPPEERDRDALIKVSPKGDVEATRFMQSTKAFVTAKSASDEESLFGLTVQELADGQFEKYAFKLLAQEEGAPLFFVEGQLKAGQESKFPRVVMALSKENYMPLTAEFYDNHNALSRRIRIDNVSQVQGHWTRMRWTVDNFARRKVTDFEVVEAKYDQNIPDSVFTEDYLKKIASK